MMYPIITAEPMACRSWMQWLKSEQRGNIFSINVSSKLVDFISWGLSLYY